MRARVNAAPVTPWAHRWREHWPIVLVLLVAAALLFTHLNRDYLWADEGDTAVLARNILKSGVPSAWDGVTFTDSDYGTRVNDDLVMVSTPWLQYYVTAASFALFGETPLAARLPFALLGLATIALVYFMVVRLARDRQAALAASILLTLEVQFLIYSRQSRYYSLVAALTCLLVWQFTRLTSWGQALIFVVVATLLFHSHPMGLAPVGALGLLTLLYAPCRELRPWFWRAMPLVAVLTLPWLALARAGYSENVVVLRDASTFIPRLLQFAIECASVTPIVGAAVLFLVLRQRARGRPSGNASGRRSRARRLAPLAPEERSLAVVLVVILIAYVLAAVAVESPGIIWMSGVRYATAVIPFGAMLAGIAIASASRGRWRVWAALILVFGFTKLDRITPWTFWANSSASRDQSAVVTFHNPEHVLDRVLRTEQLDYIRSLFEPNPGTIAGIVDFLNANAGPRDIVITNYEWEPLYFHTRLPLGMTVLPSYPIWAAAKKHDLPDYVFTDKGARWVVSRRAWGTYRGQDCDRILADLTTKGASVTLALSVPETLWENRENIHFRRFPGDRYVYPFFGERPSALIYRVDWPKTTTPEGVGRPD